MYSIFGPDELGGGRVFLTSGLQEGWGRCLAAVLPPPVRQGAPAIAAEGRGGNGADGEAGPGVAGAGAGQVQGPGESSLAHERGQCG